MDKELYRCYGQYQRLSTECQLCDVKSYCDDAKRCGSAQIHRQRTRLEVAEAMADYADLPEVFEDDKGAQKSSFIAVRKFLAYLATLSPMTLKILLHKMANPAKSRAEIAAFCGISERSLNSRILSHKPIAGMFDDYYARKPRNEAAIKRRSNVYLSGKMTGIAEYNHPAFFAAAEALELRFECYVINPAYISYMIGDHRAHADYMAVAMALLELADGVVMLPDWRDSKGASMERAKALEMGLPVYQYEDLYNGIGNTGFVCRAGDPAAVEQP